MANNERQPIPDDPGGALAGPPPGVYASDEEYYKDIAVGLPKLKSHAERLRAERETASKPNQSAQTA